jgi:hypothetical protein
LVISDINIGNYQQKIAKAIRTVSQYLGVPMTVRKVEHTHEPYFYDVQQELSDQWTGYYQGILHKIYGTLIESLGIPPVEAETMRKALVDSGVLRYRGKIIYAPETGQPIKKKDFDALIKAIENFLNRNTRDTGKRIVLDAVAVGKLLKRMAKYQTSRDMEALKLDTLKYRGKTFDWIRDDMKNIQEAFRLDGRDMSRNEIARYQVAQDWVAQKVTRVNNAVKDEIKDVILNGIVEKRSRSQVSQDLFNQLGGYNKDWKRVADTEIVNTSNLAGILEEVRQTPKGEKVYFKRVELPNCCEKCAAVNGQIALWSDTPLDDEHINDEYADIALWDGKQQEKGKTILVTGALHPNCYSDDTEVMTNNGWKLFKDLLDTDKIMSISPDTREIDFIPFIKRISYKYTGKMVYFNGKNYNLMVTPDHNMLFVSQKGFYRESLAKDLIRKRYYRLPRAVGQWTKRDNEKTVTFGDFMISKRQYVRLWAWYLAEGNGRTRSRNTHEAKLAQKIPQNIIDDLPELRNVLNKTSDSVYLGKYAEPFKEMFGIRADKKYIPDFIKESSVENIREFLEAFSLADGTRRVRTAHAKSYSENRKEQYVRTSSKRMANDLCELIVKAGWIPSIDVMKQMGKSVHFSNGDYILNTDCYNINICKSRFRGFGMDDIAGHKEHHKPTEIDYHGIVYDVELEKWHFLLVKRNGKCAWSGNCRGEWVRWGGHQVDAMTARIQGRGAEWDAAVTQAQDEYREQGNENLNDQTPGYIKRINELYREKLRED